MAAHDFELFELDLIGAASLPLPEAQAEFKTYDISKAPAQYAVELDSYQGKLKEVELAEKALSAITQPAPFQPAPGENNLFDGIQAQLAAAADERQYEQILAIAQQRVVTAKERLKSQRKTLIVYSYFADLLDLRLSLAEPIEQYREAIAAAQETREKAAEAIRQAIESQSGVSRDEKGRESREAYLPCNLELRKISLGGPLPAPPPGIDSEGAEGEQDILPRPLAADYKPYVETFDPYSATARQRLNDRVSHYPV